MHEQEGQAPGLYAAWFEWLDTPASALQLYSLLLLELLRLLNCQMPKLLLALLALFRRRWLQVPL